MIVTKQGDKLCGKSHASMLAPGALAGPPVLCTMAYGHGGDSHRVDWPVWEAMFRDGYTYHPDPEPEPSHGPQRDVDVRYPLDHVALAEFTGRRPDRPEAIFAQAADWLTEHAPVALVGVCLTYDGSRGIYGLQLAHTVTDPQENTS